MAYFDAAGRGIVSARAGNERALRAKGVRVRKTDAVPVASFCMENKHVLLHSDTDVDTTTEHLQLEGL